MNWLNKWFGPAPEPIPRTRMTQTGFELRGTPVYDESRGDTSAFKVGDRLLCVKSNPSLFITIGHIYTVPFLPSDKLVPVYNDVHGFSLCYPDHFEII